MAKRIGTISSLDKLSQMEILLRFAYNLTVIARDAYSDGTYQIREPEKLRDVNEIMHQFLQHTHHVLTDNVKRYPDEVLDSIIEELAARSGIERQIDSEWERAAKLRR